MSNKAGIGTKKEKDRKDILKGPDEFQEWVGKAAQFFMEYGVKLLIGTGVLIAAIIVTVIVSRHSKATDIEAAAQFSKAFNTVAAEVLPDEQMQALPVVDRTAVDSARKMLAEFTGKHDGDEIAGLAKVGEAIAACQAGDYAGAADILKPLVDAGALQPALASIALQVYAVAADGAGRRDEAQAAFVKMTESSSRLVKTYGYMYLGDMFNPEMKTAADQPVDQAKALEHYNAGVAAIGQLEGDSGELTILANSLKMRLERLN